MAIVGWMRYEFSIVIAKSDKKAQLAADVKADVTDGWLVSEKGKFVVIALAIYLYQSLKRLLRTRLLR